MSVLTDIDTSIDNCDIQFLVWRLWDRFIHDEIGDMTALDWNSYCLKHYQTSSYSLKTTMYKNIKERVRFLRIYDLAKTFNLTVSEIELLCNSEYVREVSKMNWFVWKTNSQGYYTATATYETAIKYLNTGCATITESCNGGPERILRYEITSNTQLDDDFNVEKQVLRNLFKQVLCSQVIWSDKFIIGFKEYFFSKMERFS